MNSKAIAPGLFVVASTLLILVTARAEQASRPGPAPGHRTWSAYGGGPEQLRYSRLTRSIATT